MITCFNLIVKMLSGSPDVRVYVIMYGHQHRRSKISISVHVGLKKRFFL